MASVVSVLVVLSTTLHASNVLSASESGVVIIKKAVDTVYQPRFRNFAEAAAQFLNVTQRSCQHRTEDTFYELRDQFGVLAVAYSGIELYRLGPLLEQNRRRRLFFWPDSLGALERHMARLLADAGSVDITEEALSTKSAALQGLPAVERLLFGNHAKSRFAVQSTAPDCQVVTAIAQNISTMAVSLYEGWQWRTEFVESMFLNVVNSHYFQSEQEVLSSMVAQIVQGMDSIRLEKIALLGGDEASWSRAPLWLSEQTMPMLKGNFDSLRALTLDSGLAAMADLENELAFEFRTADSLLQALVELPASIDETDRLSDQARSLVRSLTAVTDAIAFTLNDRLSPNLRSSMGFDDKDIH